MAVSRGSQGSGDTGQLLRLKPQGGKNLDPCLEGSGLLWEGVLSEDWFLEDS